MTLESPLRLGAPLDGEALAEIRRTLELRHFKWDTQVGDVSVLFGQPLLISRQRWHELSALAVRLFHETLALETALSGRPKLLAALGVPRALARALLSAASTPALARVMRFDFHFTTEGWRVSEVNSDVPGGYTESSHFCRLMAEHVPGAAPTGDPTRALVDAITARLGGSGAIALTCAPGHLEDAQIVAHLASALQERGLASHVVSLPTLAWSDGRARLGAGPFAGQPLDAIFRFYQAEWLARLPTRIGWPFLLAGGHTPVTNPGAAALSESKRIPLVWDDLGVRVETWRSLLPETRPIRAAPWRSDDGWLIKSAYSNTGDTVSVRSAMSPALWARRSFEALLRPGRWLAQRRFTVAPLEAADGRVFPCVGVYVIEGVAAGAYTRLARGSVVDFAAQDAALLLYEDA